jgi:hypothetical protein
LLFTFDGSRNKINFSEHWCISFVDKLILIVLLAK